MVKFFICAKDLYLNIVLQDADIAGNTFMETFRYSKSCSEDSVNVTASELPVTSISGSIRN